MAGLWDPPKWFVVCLYSIHIDSSKKSGRRLIWGSIPDALVYFVDHKPDCGEIAEKSMPDAARVYHTLANARYLDPRST